MSNKVSSHLHDLICALTKSEKRYFKVLSSKHVIGEANKYMTLFDFLDSMDTYNEDKVMEKFKGEAFLNKFSITKARLYDNILKALEQYHSGNSVDAQIFSLLNSADILYNKSLYKQSKKIVRSAEKLAEKNHRYTLLIEISIRMKKLIETGNYTDIDQDEIEAMKQQDELRISRLATYLNLWNIKSELFYLINRENRARNMEEIGKLKEIIQDLSKIPDTGYFFDSMYLKNHIQSAYYFYIGKFDESLQFLLRNLELFRSNKIKIKSDSNVYYAVLVNTIFIANKLDEKQIFKDTLNELKLFPEVNKLVLTDDMEIKMFSSTNSLELSLLINYGDFEKATKLIPEIENGLLHYDDKINEVRKSFLYFQVAYALFGAGEFKESLRWINKILNADSRDIKEIVGYTNLLNLILHYELDNKRLLPYALKSVERYFGKKTEDKSFEKLFLKYFKKIIKKETEINRKELFYDLHENIKKIQEPQIQIPLEYFRFDLWVESKAKNVAFASLCGR